MPSTIGSLIPSTAVPVLPTARVLTEPNPLLYTSPPTHEPMLGTPLRCRLGFHHWVPLALSLAGARRSFGISFCRRCPAVRRPA